MRGKRQKGKANPKQGQFRGRGPKTRDNNNWNERDRDGQTERSARNDISWYSRYPDLLVATSQLAYPYRPGMTIKLGSHQPTSATKPINVSTAVPGVMVLNWVPSIGISNNNRDPASIMGQEIYTAVRKVYSGDIKADAPDFVMYLLALDSVFAGIAAMKRVYRILNAWTPNNYVTPDILLKTLGVTSPDTWRQQKTALFGMINELIYMSHRFRCPGVFDYFNRHYWMNDNVYTDAQTINSQFYVFRQCGLYQFGLVDMPSGDPAGGLTMVDFRTWTNPVTVYTVVKNLINALSAWSDSLTINGYLERAFEGVPTFQVAPLLMDEQFTPVFEPEVLAQIENSWTCSVANLGGINEWDGMTISQDVLTNSVLSNPSISVSSAVANPPSDPGQIPVIFSARSDSPTVSDNIIASRLKTQILSTTEANNKVTFKVMCASELCINWEVVDGDGNHTPFVQWAMILRSNTVSTNTATFALQSINSAQFDWHPFAFYTTYSTASESEKAYVMGDTHNMTITTIDVLREMHKICLYSLLNSFSI